MLKNLNKIPPKQKTSYTSKILRKFGLFVLKNKIRKIVVKNNIQFVDIDSVFKDFKVNNVDIYNLSIYGHYTKYGYNLIADKLIKTLSN